MVRYLLDAGSRVGTVRVPVSTVAWVTYGTSTGIYLSPLPSAVSVSVCDNVNVSFSVGQGNLRLKER